MAGGYVSPDDWLGKLSGSIKDTDKRYKAEEAIREASRSKLLTTNDIISGKWDAERTLLLTSNGRITLTSDDLKAFKANQKRVAKSYENGITAQQVINLSLQADRDRANREIRMAVPSSFTNGLLRFITNAGGTTAGVHRHFVNVEFITYDKSATASDKNARQEAMRLKNQKLKINCDCRRWRFWYRYVASIAGYNEGKPETGFPKIRNPNLNGVACKHILRVMHELKYGGAVVNFMASHMEKAKAHDKNIANTRNKQKEAEELAKRQNKRTKSHELRVKEKIEKAVKKVAEETTKKIPPTKNPPKKYADKEKLRSIQVLLESGLITPQQAKELEAKLRNGG